MNDRELERKLADAVTRAAPDDLEAILSRCGAQNGSVMEMNQLISNESMKIAQAKSRKAVRPWLAAACAALVLLGTGGGGLLYHQSHAVASVVSLDVNPSIELKVNRNEKVISCTALNTEAAAVLFNMGGGADLEGTKLDVAVNAIVGALVREGYLDSISSAILISVEDNDQERAQRLQAELVASVDGVLQAQAPGTDVLSQVVDQGTLRVEYGNVNNISSGKAALVEKVLAMNGAGEKAFDQLAALSVEELSDLLKAGEKRIPIGKSAAATAAETYAGTLALDSVTTDVDPELDELPPHYEVELKTAWGEFEYIVDAFTGQVLSGPKDLLTSGGDTNPPSPGTDTPVSPDASAPQTPPSGAQGQDVGQEAAKQAALSHAGLSASDVTDWKIKREWDDGRLEYEIEFWCGTDEYDYTIDGHSCSVLKHELERHPHQDGTHHNGSVSGITLEAAKAAALSHAGLKESQVWDMKAELDYDDGRLEYEVEFKSGGMEYEYTIDGVTGSILSFDREVDD
ncbi:hypothetical protein N510_000974 [Firmicutes bacterium ASF500]|nr:hypothetical protein N510_000974 [Firmicutes bacterium ASF500]